MPKSTNAQTNITAGEISPRALGHFDLAKYANAVKILENFLIYQLGGALFRPGTRFVTEVKNSSVKTRVIQFAFSIDQTYRLELGDNYMRFCTNQGQLIDAGIPVEIATPWSAAEIFDVHVSQNADTMYMTHPNHHPRKLTRTSAVTFSLVEVPFVRGPFMDDNITATTIDASADVGAGITLTASVAIFDVGHIGSLWRVKDAVVKITGFTSTTILDGDVQAEPDGTAGDINAGGAPQTDWAEGEFSTLRGFPATNTFHEQRLYYAKTATHPQDFWGSVIAAYDNFLADPTDDTAAVHFQIVSEQVNAIRWLSSDARAMQNGTSGGTFSAASGPGSSPITAGNISVTKDTNYGVANIQPKRIASALYYLQRNSFQLRELIFSFEVDTYVSEDMTLLADHVIRDGGGARDMSYQQSPNDRIWVVRNDGQMAVLTRNAGQEVVGWSRIIAGRDAVGAGKFESVAVNQTENGDDEVWVTVRRVIDGQVKRYIEFFTPEYFDDPWDPVRVDASLTYDNPVDATDATQTSPVVVSAPGHGLANGDLVRLSNFEGMTELNGNVYKVAGVVGDDFNLTDEADDPIDGTGFSDYVSGGEVRKMVDSLTGLDHLEGETVTVQVDGGLPAGAQTYVVLAGMITLENKAAVVHVGLPYVGNMQLLKLSDGSLTIGQTKNRRIYLSTLRVFRSLGIKIGMNEEGLNQVYFNLVNNAPGKPPDLFTGDVEKHFETFWSKEGEILIRQDVPIPLFILMIALRSEVEEKD